MIVICGVLDGNNGLGVFRSMLSTWRQFGLIRVLGNSLLGALWVALFFLLLRNGELQDELMVLPALDNIWVRFCVGLPLTSPHFDNYFSGLHIDPCPSHGFGHGKLLDRHALDPILWRVRQSLWPIGVLRLYQAADEGRDECTICLADFVPGKEVGHPSSFLATLLHL